MSSAKRLKYFLRYHVIRLGLTLVGALPWSWAGALGDAFGAMAYRLASRERQKTLTSLAVAFPELSEDARFALGRRTFRHLGRCTFELACLHQQKKVIPGI